MDCRGQVSAELIIVIAAVLAIAFMLVHSLHESADAGDALLDKNAGKALKEAKKV